MEEQEGGGERLQRRQPQQGKTLPKHFCTSICVGGMFNDAELKLVGKMSYCCLALDMCLPSPSQNMAGLHQAKPLLACRQTKMPEAILDLQAGW